MQMNQLRNLFFKTTQFQRLSQTRNLQVSGINRSFSSQSQDNSNAQSSNSQQQPKEYIVNEQELFSEKKMEEARQSIQEKLKQISQSRSQFNPSQKNEELHKPEEYNFTKASKLVKEISAQNVYFYKKPLKFPEDNPEKGILVFQMNKDIYKTANLVDWFVSALTFYSTYKLIINLKTLFTLGFAQFSFMSTGFWALVFMGQVNYLGTSYMRQVYLVSEIELLRNLEEVKIRTVLNDKTNAFRFGRKDTEQIIPIRDLRYSEKDKPDSPILRIIVGDKKYFCHKNASLIQDFELLKAILTPNVHKIDVFK
eukprot:403364726